MSLFRKVSMKDIDKYTETPAGIKGMQCQLNVNGPQFFEARSNNRRGIQVKKGAWKGAGKGHASKQRV